MTAPRGAFEKDLKNNEPFSPELAAQSRGSAWWCGKEWVRSGCGAHEGRTALHCLEPSRVITPILASPGALLVRKAQSVQDLQVGCPQAVTSRRRCAPWRYRSRAEESGCSECPPWLTGSRRRWSPKSRGKRVEPIFHPDSYGYRPGRSALDAVGQCRRRCWNRAWVVDLDIARFFDEVDHQLLLKAVAGHAPEPWVLLYISRWLKAPIQHGDGTIAQRSRGTPQGSAVSPVLANLFLHYAFDMWMARRFPTVQFERYVDDVVVHCVTERQAREVREAVEGRLARVGLRMHPDKTRIVYCRTQKRRGDHPEVSFDFLGYTFRPRAARDGKGGIFTSFLPAISKSALKRLSARVRSWRLHLRTGSTFTGLARTINPIVRGWMQYYGRFYRTALYPLLKRINAYLVRWLRKKYKRLRTFKKAKAAWRRVTRQCPLLLSHWAWVQSFW